MSNIAIRVERLGRRYRIGGPQTGYKTIRETLLFCRSRHLEPTFGRRSERRY